MRIPDELAAWLAETAKRSGVPQSQIVREELERARSADKERRFMRLAGLVAGPRDLSARKGFSRR